LSLVIIAGWSGYDPIAQSISLLANAPLGWLQTAAFVTGGLLGAAWAFGLSVSQEGQAAMVRDQAKGDPPALRGRRARGEDGNPVYAHTRRLRWSASSPNASANPTSRSRRG